MVSRVGSAAPAHGESASTHALASEPVIRKFVASGSAGGNVAGTSVLCVVTDESMGAMVVSGPAMVVTTSKESVCRR